MLRWANRSDVAREVTRRGYRVSGETLNRWVRQQKEVPAVVERIVFDLFTITPDTQKDAPAWWAEASAGLLGELEAQMNQRVSDGVAQVLRALPEKVATELERDLGLDAPPADADPPVAAPAPPGGARRAPR